MKLLFKNKKKYKDLENLSLGSIGKLKIEEDLVPQGINYVAPFILISCYSTEKRKSRVLFFDENSILCKEIELENRSHVGGISYDKIHNLLWICNSKGRISSYKYHEFLNGDLSSKKDFLVADNSLGGGFLIEEGKTVCSYLTYFDNKVYVGSFNKKKNGLVKVFDVIRESTGIELKYRSEFNVPEKIQGLTFYKQNNETYMLLSKSYTRIKDSSIFIYKYIENKNDYTEKSCSLTLPPMLEQIALIEENIILLFESFAKKYSYNAKVVIDDIFVLNTQKILEKFF